MRKWWQIGLSAREIESLEAEGRALCVNGNGPAERRAVLSRARSYGRGRRHPLEAMRLGRLAACMADQIKENTQAATLNNEGNDLERA